MMFRPAILIVLSLICRTFVQSYNILAVFPIDLPSHIKPFQPLLYELSRRGHNVTELSSFEPPTGLNGYNFLHLPSTFPAQNTMIFRNQSHYQLIGLYHSLCLKSMEAALRTPQIQSFIQNDRSHFDLIIIEGTFCSECLVALGHKYGAPILNFQPLAYCNTNYFLYGNLLSPAYMPDFRIATTPRMNIWGRLNSLWFALNDFYLHRLHYYPKQEALMRQYIKYPGFETRPPMLDMLQNLSMTFIEHDINIGVPQPLSPNIVMTGGMHIKPAKALPADLAALMSDAPHGVIYISFGTNIKFAHMPPYVMTAFLHAFKRLKQKILWKSDVDVETPSNVLVKRWFPQTDILNHKNCSLFFTHGGIHSVMEAGYHGVPVVMMPGFSDQFQNVLLMQEKGLGKVISLDSVNADVIVEAIETVLNDPTYAENARRISYIMKSEPMTSLQKGVFWTEYILKHKGAHFLKPASIKLSLAQYLCMDLIFFVFSTTAVCLYVLMKLFSFCLSLKRNGFVKEKGKGKKNKSE